MNASDGRSVLRVCRPDPDADIHGRRAQRTRAKQRTITAMTVPSFNDLPLRDVLQPEDYYRMLVELAPDVIYSIAAEDACFLSLSPAFERITGWSVDEWLGRPFAGIVHPDDLPAAVKNFQSVLSGGRTGPFELRVRTKAGGYVVGEFVGMPRVEAGRVVGSIGIARDVSDRKRAEREVEHLQEQLRYSRDQLDAILQGINDGITVQEPGGRIVYANATAARASGFSTVAELLEHQGADALGRYEILDSRGRRIDPDELPGRKVLRGEPAPEMELLFRSPATGERRWVLMKSAPVTDPDGTVRLAVNVFQDITERRAAAEMRERMAAIVESTSDAIVGKDLHATIHSWNPGAEAMYGYTADEIIGRSVAVIIPDDRDGELDSIMERVRRGERIEHFETVRVRKDGVRLDVSISVSPIRDPQGNILGAATIARDITREKRSQQERAALLAREREARARAETVQARLAFLARASELLSESLDLETTLGNLARLAVPYLGDWCLIDVVEEDGSIRRIALSHPDPARMQLARELEKRYPPDLESPDAVHRTGVSQLYADVSEDLLSRATVDDEHLRIVRDLGLTSAMAVPLVARDRILGGMAFLAAESGRHYGPDDLAFAEDLARRAAVAVDNARLFRDAQAALQLREEFLSIASHELKTPLTALQLQLQLLQHAIQPGPAVSPASDRVERMLTGAGRQLRRLSTLVNDLLDVARITAGRIELAREQVDLRDTTREVIDRFEEEQLSSGSTVTLHPGAPVVGLFDRFRLDQVLTNILSNALKYGRGNPVDVTVEAEGGVARVRVKDRGIGIAPEHVPLVFERFERVALSQSYGGLGLGLYIARQIVQAHGGTIAVDSELGVGATFTVDLPLAV